MPQHIGDRLRKSPVNLKSQQKQKDVRNVRGGRPINQALGAPLVAGYFGNGRSNRDVNPIDTGGASQIDIPGEGFTNEAYQPPNFNPCPPGYTQNPGATGDYDDPYCIPSTNMPGGESFIPGVGDSLGMAFEGAFGNSIPAGDPFAGGPEDQPGFGMGSHCPIGYVYEQTTGECISAGAAGGWGNYNTGNDYSAGFGLESGECMPGQSWSQELQQCVTSDSFMQGDTGEDFSMYGDWFGTTGGCGAAPTCPNNLTTGGSGGAGECATWNAEAQSWQCMSINQENWNYEGGTEWQVSPSEYGMDFSYLGDFAAWMVENGYESNDPNAWCHYQGLSVDENGECFQPPSGTGDTGGPVGPGGPSGATQTSGAGIHGGGWNPGGGEVNQFGWNYCELDNHCDDGEICVMGVCTDQGEA